MRPCGSRCSPNAPEGITVPWRRFVLAPASQSACLLGWPRLSSRDGHSGGEGSVSDKSNREVVERYIRATMEQDFETEAQLRDPDFVMEFPQSGERIRGV